MAPFLAPAASRRALRLAVRLSFPVLLAGASPPAHPGPARPSLVDLVQVADISGVSASPDGAKVAFRVERGRLDTNDYPSDWYIADLATGAVRQVGPGGAAIYRDPGVSEGTMPVWSQDGAEIYYRALVDDAVEIWRADADGGAARRLVRQDEDIRQLKLAPDGKALLIDLGPSRATVRAAEQREYDSGILVDKTVDLGQSVYRGALINGRHATQRLTGNWFTRDQLMWNLPVRQRRVDLATLAISEMPPPPPPAPRAEVLSIKPETQLFTSKGGSSAQASWDWRARKGTLVFEPAGQGAKITCNDEPCGKRIAWGAWRTDRDELIFSTQDNFAHSLYAWNPGGNRLRLVAQSAGFLNGGRESEKPCALGIGAAICVAAEAGGAPRLERIDLDTGSRSLVFDPNAEIRKDAIMPESLSWKGKAGHQYTGWLFHPPGAAGRTPLFVTYYTCDGFLRGGTGDEWPLGPLAASGIAALCINKTPVSNPDTAIPTYRAALEGVESAVELLDRRGLVDPTKVGMGGLSFGSEATMWTVIHSDLLAAASVASPTFEQTYYWLNGVRGRDNHATIAKYWGLKAPQDSPKQWKMLSAALNVDRIRAPLLMQLPEQEARNSIELYARLTNSPTPAEMYVFPDEPHLKFLPRHKLAAYERNLDWFRYWLQGYVDPDPLKAAQYERWRALAARRCSDAARSDRSKVPAAAPCPER